MALINNSALNQAIMQSLQNSGLRNIPFRATPSLRGIPFQQKALGLFQIRNPYTSELTYFQSNPNVAGMATEDNSVILNPYNENMSDPNKRNSVIQNEGIRLLINTLQAKPTFQVTDDQKAYFKGTPYASDEQKLRETIAARIFSGDPSAGQPTQEQLQYIDFLRQHIPK